MPKQKRKSALAKRIKVTASGKVRRHQAYTSHLAQNKSTKQKRQSRQSCLMHPSDVKRMKGIM